MAGRGGEPGGSDEDDPDEAPASLFMEEEDSEGGLLTDMLLCYESFHLDPSAGRVTFTYKLLDVRSLVQLEAFTTSLALPPCAAEQYASVDATAAAFAVGMVSLAWLWVGLPCQTVLVRAKQLDASEVAFWSDTLNGCLGEFFQFHPGGAVWRWGGACGDTLLALSPMGGSAQTALHQYGPPLGRSGVLHQRPGGLSVRL